METLAPASPPTYLSIAQVAARLQVGRTMVRRLIKNGALKACRIGDLYRISESDFNDYLSRATVTVPAE